MDGLHDHLIIALHDEKFILVQPEAVKKQRPLVYLHPDSLFLVQTQPQLLFCKDCSHWLTG